MKLDFAALGQRVYVADGAWATQLWTRGVAYGTPAEFANVSAPDVVLGLGRAYVEAGAEILTTNTFSANRFALERSGAAGRVRELNEAGARLARQAAGADVAVAGSMGPSGKLVVVQEAESAALLEGFREQAEALAAGGVDFLVLETFAELAEILLAVQAARSTGLPVVASMSFDSGPQRTRTIMGAPAEQCAVTLEQAGVAAVGFNCGAGMAHALPAVVALRANTALPLWVKPSAGLPELELGRAVYRCTPEEFTAPVATLLDASISVIGGCCGVGPEHIRRLAALVTSRQRGARGG